MNYDLHRWDHPAPNRYMYIRTCISYICEYGCIYIHIYSCSHQSPQPPPPCLPRPPPPRHLCHVRIISRSKNGFVGTSWVIYKHMSRWLRCAALHHCMRCVASLHALRCITASTTLHRCIKQLPQPLPRCPPWPTQAKAFVLTSTKLSYLTRLSTGGIILRCGGTSPVGNRAVEERMISRSKNEFVGLHTSAFRELRWPQCALQ